MPAFNIMAAGKAFGIVLLVFAGVLCIGFLGGLCIDLLGRLDKAYGDWGAFGVVVLGIAVMIGAMAGFSEAKH